MRGLERDGFRAARDAHRPRRREPGRRESGLLETDVHAEAAQLRRDQLLRLGMRGRAGDASPPLVAGVAALARDRRQLLDVRLQLTAVDPAVRRRGRGQRPAQIILLERHQRRADDRVRHRGPRLLRREASAKHPENREHPENLEHPENPENPANPENPSHLPSTSSIAIRSGPSIIAARELPHG